MAKLPTVKMGRTRVYRAGLDLMVDGRIWCYACAAASPAPDTEDYEEWHCKAGHGYWYHDEMSSVQGEKQKKARLARLRKEKQSA